MSSSREPIAPPRNHYCHAWQCITPVPRRMFMCRVHWYMVPKSLRDQIWKHYREGQEEDPILVTEKYLKVTRKAIQKVAKQEGYKLNDR